MPDLADESIRILRDVPTFRKPVFLYSIGKDSSVLLDLIRRAFWPARPPFPMLHIDTGWKFREMIAHRDRMARESGMELIVHTHEEGRAEGLNPFDHGARYTDVMKTAALKQALDAHGFDCAIGGARRDEEKSRAKERVFSVRAPGHRWDPKRQRPELWRVFNTRIRPGETVRVFPLSDWTELDIWRYIRDRDVPIPALYYAKERPVVSRGGTLVMVDDERMRLAPGESVVLRRVRFRTLGCYPLTGAIESDADTLDAIIGEMERATTSERAGRLIDRDQGASMERKKHEGYF